MSSSFLLDACAAAHERVRTARKAEPIERLRERALQRTPGDFAGALAGEGVGVIAEVKRASPSRGRMASIPDPAALARRYADGGAAAVSVLTEPQWFSGSLTDLEEVAASAGLPVLRKDFVVDPYQIWEARAAGASAVLLIIAAVRPMLLSELIAEAEEAGLVALLEVHDAFEVELACQERAVAGATGPFLLGVNARDLVSLQVDEERFEAVSAGVPDDATVIAESGVRGPDDVRRLVALGADAVLVGEHVATAEDPAAAVRALVAAGADIEPS